MQAIADTGPLGDDLVASVDEELEVGLEVGLPEPWEARLAQGDPGDRDRVARIILAPTAAGPPAIGGQVRRDVDDFLVEGEEPPAQGQAEPPRALDGDEARTVEGVCPRDEPLELARACPDLEGPKWSAVLVDRSRGVGLRVRVDPDDDLPSLRLPRRRLDGLGQSCRRVVTPL